MSDPIAQAAEVLSAAPSSTEPLVVQAVAEQPAPAVIAPAIAPVTGNVLVNDTPVVDAGNGQAAATAYSPQPNSTTSAPSSPEKSTENSDSSELPRESHLMLLEHKLAAMHAKFKTGERIVIDEFEQILGHIRAVL